MMLVAHLLRRAGFWCDPYDLEAYVAKGYDAVVEELLHPSDPQAMPEDIIRRYHVDSLSSASWTPRERTRCTHGPDQVPIRGEDGALLARPFRDGYAKLNQARAL